MSTRTRVALVSVVLAVLASMTFGVVHLRLVGGDEYEALELRQRHFQEAIGGCQAVLNEIDAFDRKREELDHQLARVEIASRLPLTPAAIDQTVALFAGVQMSRSERHERETVIHFVGTGPPEEAAAFVGSLDVRGAFTVRRMIKGTSVTQTEAGEELRIPDRFSSPEGWEVTVWIEEGAEPRPADQPAPEHPDVFWPWNKALEGEVLELEARYEELCELIPDGYEEMQRSEALLERALATPATGARAHPVHAAFELAFCGETPPLAYGTVTDMAMRRNVVAWPVGGLQLKDVVAVFEPRYAVADASLVDGRVSLDIEPLP